MKKIIFSIMLLFSIGILKANPIIPPPFISEIYFNDTIWYIELNYYSSNDSIRLISHTDTAYISCHNWFIGQIIILTQDSLLTPFYINRNGDSLVLQTYTGSNDWYSNDNICWGTYSCNVLFECNVNAPFIGQSLIMTEIKYGDVFAPESTYWLVKDNTPSLGTSVYQANSKGTFCGYVYDSQHNPISNIRLQYCSNYFLFSPYANLTQVITDNNGYFYNADMFAKNYDITFNYNFSPYNNIVDTTISITIEPDSANCYEFIIDTILTSKKNISIHQNFLLSCYPNPSNGKTTISFELPENIHFTNILIKIYNSTGEMIRILPVDISGKQNKYSVEWDGKCYDNSIASGTYYCNLELDGKKVATNKLIITK